MSSIMRARSALTGRTEGWEVIGGSSLELKVAGPSMLGIRCPGRHALPLTPPQRHRPPRALQSRESGFVLGWFADLRRGPLERQGCADSGPSRHRAGTGRFDPFLDLRPACAYAISRAGRRSARLQSHTIPGVCTDDANRGKPLPSSAIWARRALRHPLLEGLDQPVMTDRRGGPRLAIRPRAGVV